MKKDDDIIITNTAQTFARSECHEDNITANDGDVLILAIESSCDETAAAVVRNGREVLSNVIYSQIALHTVYGGVVPEIASRKHIEKVIQVIDQALVDANMKLQDMDCLLYTSPSPRDRG